jgi:hypothetical protein
VIATRLAAAASIQAANRARRAVPIEAEGASSEGALGMSRLS